MSKATSAHCNSLRAEVRNWIDRCLDRDWRRQLEELSEDEITAYQMNWMRQLVRAGYAVPTLPEQYGGAGFSFHDQTVIIEEMARADTPPLDMFMVTQIHAPLTLLEWGTSAQKEKFLPGIAKGDLWCQGFSEPNAGSDLAALRTGAIQDGDYFVLNGQKSWSSFSKHALYCLLLVRTDFDAPKRQGISYFILDMNSPGIEVRPIRQVTGNAEFSEIFLNDVRVPAANLLGSLNDGWRVAQSTLSAERGINSFERVERLWYHLMRFLRAEKQANASWLKDSQKLGRLATVIASISAERQLIRAFMNNEEMSNDESYPPVIKVSSTEIAQALAAFLLSVRGMSAQFYKQGYEPDAREPMFDYLFSFGNTISAGTNEIMRTIIAERVLGMPR